MEVLSKCLQVQFRWFCACGSTHFSLSTVKVDVNYRSWARKRDSADPESITFTSREDEKVGPLHSILHKPSISGSDLHDIKERDGMIVEGDDGVPLLILLTSVQWPGLKVLAAFLIFTRTKAY